MMFLLFFLLKIMSITFFTTLYNMHKCIVFTVNENFSGKTHFFDINIIKNSYNSFFLLPCTEKNFSPLYISWKSFFLKLKNIQCINKRAFLFRIFFLADCMDSKLKKLTIFFSHKVTDKQSSRRQLR